jgi:hypothetical protein
VDQRRGGVNSACPPPCGDRPQDSATGELMQGQPAYCGEHLNDVLLEGQERGPAWCRVPRKTRSACDGVHPEFPGAKGRPSAPGAALFPRVSGETWAHHPPAGWSCGGGRVGVLFSKSPRGRPARSWEPEAANPLNFKTRFWLRFCALPVVGGGGLSAGVGPGSGICVGG